MANSYKDIIITPNRGNTADPKIEFRGANTTVNTAITLQTYPTSNGTLSFEGSAGQLFSITNDLTGSIFSVNDVSGIPSIEVFANGQINLAQYGGNVVFGNTSTLSAYRLLVTGNTSPLIEATGGASSHAYISANRASAAAGEVGLLFKSAGGVDWYNYESASSTTLKWYAGGADRLQLSNTGVLTASGDIRAPIFYDSDDTNYYLNPNGDSVMRGTLTLHDNGANSPLLDIRADDGAPWAIRLYRDDFGNGPQVYASDVNTWYFNHTIRAGAAAYAPVFYDENNTGYYFDGTGATAISINGGITFAAANPSITASSYFVCPGGAYFNSGTVYTEANIKARGGVGNDSGEALTLTGGTGGYTVINGSTRSPIFYDSNNTGYYIDPASTSILFNFQNINQRVAYDRSWDNYPSITVFNTTDQGPQADFRIHGAPGSNGGDFSVRLLVDGDITSLAKVNAGADMRAPIYYDSDNTGYYTDPASTSNINALTVAGATTFNANVTFGAADHIVLSSTSGISANGTFGTAGQVLTSNGTVVYWAAAAAGVNTNATYTWSNNHTFQANVTVQGTLIETSSLRYKENIHELTYSADTVSKLRPVTYKKIGSGVTEIGLIAEEVDSVVPEVVSYDSMNRPDGINYSRMVAILINAVKAQQKQIDSLENEIRLIRGSIDKAS